jgi:site-specific DNA recombinase
MTLRVALYARVSTPHQTQAQTIGQQLERLKQHVREQGWLLQDEHVFQDDGLSGASLNRPGLDRLRDSVRYGEVDCILITTPDRLARNYVHQMILLDELERCGCQVTFLDRPMSQDPNDQLLLQIRGAVAEYERTLITDRMRRGRFAKYRAGILLPWSKPPYGYRLSPDHPRDPSGVRIEESEAAVIREIFSLYLNEGYTLCKLAKYLRRQAISTPSGKQLWGLATLRAILRQPAYTGKIYAGRSRYRTARIRRSATHPIGQPHQTAVELPVAEWILVATIPSIVSEEEFDLAQKRLEQNKSLASRNNKSHQYLLRALVSCGLCQSACIARALDHGKYKYYVCSAKQHAIHSRKEHKCPARFIPTEQLDELVWQDLCDVLTHPDSITYALQRAHGGHWLPQELQARRQNLRRGREHLEKQVDRLTEAYLAEVIPLAEFQRRRIELEQKAQALASQEIHLASQIDRQLEVAALVISVEDFCQRIQTSLDNATFEQKRQLVELLVDRVIVTDEDVEIRYVIPTNSASEHIRFCHLRSDYFNAPDMIGVAANHIA